MLVLQAISSPSSPSSPIRKHSMKEKMYYISRRRSFTRIQITFPIYISLMGTQSIQLSLLRPRPSCAPIGIIPPFESFPRLNECRSLAHAGSNRIYLRCHCSLKRIALEFGAMEYLIWRSDRRFGIARVRHSSGRSLHLIGGNCFAC